jgi:hypothetical protein
MARASARKLLIVLTREMVSLNVASWNLLTGWLRRIDHLRAVSPVRAGSIPASFSRQQSARRLTLATFGGHFKHLKAAGLSEIKVYIRAS